MSIISEWLVNLSAGWFAAAFIVPTTIKRSVKVNVWLLTANTLLCIISLFIAVEIRRYLGVL